MEIDKAIAEGVLDHDRVDWSEVEAASYRIEQSFHYSYPGPIQDLHQRFVIAPPTVHGDQRRLTRTYTATIDAQPYTGRDIFLNSLAEYHLPRVEREITFEFSANVRRTRGLIHEVPRSLATDALAAPRRLIRADGALLDAAADLRRSHRHDPEALAHAISAFVHAEMTYSKNTTDVFTTASTAFAMRRGVCQDYAHVALAIARACKLEARYVSGHLLGEGATHAWLEILVPAGEGRARVIALDPTHGRVPTLRYLVVAVGRDYEDVAPASGAYTAPYSGMLTARHNVSVTGITLAA